MWCSYCVGCCFLSLCGGDMMSGMLPWIYPYDSISCTYLKNNVPVKTEGFP